MAKKSKNIIEIEHNRKMIEVVSFLMLTEYTKKRLADKKQYPNFNLKESEENIQKYKVLVHQYQDKIYELDKKEKKKLENKIKKEISIKAINSKLSAVAWLEENLNLDRDVKVSLLFEQAKKMEKHQAPSWSKDCSCPNETGIVYCCDECGLPIEKYQKLESKQ